MTPEELKQKLEELKAKQADDIKAAVEAQKAANEAKAAELKALIDEQKTQIEGLKTQLNELEIKGNDTKLGKKELKCLAAQLSELDLKSISGKGFSGGFKGFFVGFEGKSDEEVEQEFKAATNITIDGLIPTATDQLFITRTEVESGLNQSPREASVIMKYVDVRRTSARNIVWVNKFNPQGNAGFTAEGALKPLRSFQEKTENSTAVKLAVRFHVSTESLEDVPGLMGDIRTDGFEQLEDTLAENVLTGDGSADDLKGLVENATAYTLTTVKGTPGADADDFGAIRAAAAQLRTLKFKPNVAVINPIDAANMDLTKGSNGQYVMPFANGNRLAPGFVIEESNEVPVGYLLIGDLKRYHVRPYLGPRLDIGTDGDDFSKNMRTIIVEQRLHGYMKSVDAGAIIYDTFANIKTAITAAAV